MREELDAEGAADGSLHRVQVALRPIRQQRGFPDALLSSRRCSSTAYGVRGRLDAEVPKLELLMALQFPARNVEAILLILALNGEDVLELRELRTESGVRLIG